jgi:hypothetical protein
MSPWTYSESDPLAVWEPINGNERLGAVGQDARQNVQDLLGRRKIGVF